MEPGRERKYAALIGVKYCGGCREQYDRRAGFESTREVFTNVVFVPVEDGGSYDALLVLCGCPAKCADISKYVFGGRAVTVDCESGFIRAADELRKALETNNFLEA